MTHGGALLARSASNLVWTKAAISPARPARAWPIVSTPLPWCLHARYCFGSDSGSGTGLLILVLVQGDPE